MDVTRTDGQRKDERAGGRAASGPSGNGCADGLTDRRTDKWTKGPKDERTIGRWMHGLFSTLNES